MQVGYRTWSNRRTALDPIKSGSKDKISHEDWLKTDLFTRLSRSDFRMRFRLKEADIQYKGMTQEELAEKVNITREHLGRLERGKYGCSIDLLIES